jgi:RNA methyltransferase, TrmH family
MTRRPFISSSSNPRLKTVRRLRRGPRRNGSGAFLAEGYRQLVCALEAGARIRELFVAPELYLGGSDDVQVALAEERGAVVTELGAAAFESISGQVRRDGIVAVVERWPTSLDALPLGPGPLFLVAERVERPGNLGTIVRTACGAGADGLVVCDGATDPFHPEAVRGSAGTLFKLRIAESSAAEAISWLRERGFRVIVATPEATRAHWDADFSGATAIVVGNERYGVTEQWRNAADETVRIPMHGPADSLNVAVAAGIVVFEAVHQRLTPASVRQ